MKLEQSRWIDGDGWDSELGEILGDSAQLVLLFGSRAALAGDGRMEQIRESYPRAHLLGCSTAGEIRGTQVSDDSLVATAVAFERTRLAGSRVAIEDASDSRRAGETLGRALDPDGLVHVFVLSDGVRVNGSELVRGLTETLPAGVTITGGLSGDGSRFERTLVVWDGPAAPNTIAALGFYGDSIRVGFASLGGWDSFGPERRVTRSSGNVLFELDGRSALELYKKYLGEHASGLPATGLLFPLSVRTAAGDPGVVRTILSVSESEQSLTFAGDVPEGSFARLMKANFDRLVDGAMGAARNCLGTDGPRPVDLAILISCVGRKLILKQRVEEEVEGVREVLGASTVLTGFYSYGEISPFTPNARCELHNQTMTITTLSES
ncbi:MAG: FIST C-terminal domain-containing protein [Acidobacteria bacterium]|nr:FIST C-terminal domain-containing protein [Acidobacteriota bacterium]